MDEARSEYRRGIDLLRTGNLREGFRLYERRHEFLYAELRGALDRRWTGQDLRGKTIFVFHEQGFGDSIQFVRYVPLLADRGARVVLGVPKELLTLFSRVPGVSQIVARDENLAFSYSPLDYWCPLMGLAHGFGTELADIPREVPYLTADAKLIDRWRLPPDQSKIGVAWATRPSPPGRAVPLNLIKTIFEGVCKPVILQKDGGGTGNLFRSFDDTAAIIAQLDLVISSDTAVAHLAGALGRPVWFLLKEPADWRWMERPADTPWYPTARLYRQHKPGDWSSVVPVVRRDLIASGCGSRIRPVSR